MMQKFAVDVLQSEISFTIKLLNTNVKGTFDSYLSTLRAETLEQLSNAEVNFEIDVASIDTNESMRDQHLKSADFFNTDLYPKIYFTKTSIVKHTNEEYLLTGDITIKNITLPVTFKVVKAATNTPSFICTTEVSRKDFDLVYNPMFEKINQLDDIVYIEVKITLLQ